nr:hypothetical protein L204_02861 [Cryptococcus depauperatus CBS 7855]
MTEATMVNPPPRGQNIRALIDGDRTGYHQTVPRVDHGIPSSTRAEGTCQPNAIEVLRAMVFSGKRELPRKPVSRVNRSKRLALHGCRMKTTIIIGCQAFGYLWAWSGSAWDLWSM